MRADHERDIGVREVLRLAWPVIVSMLSFNAMAVADAIFVGQLGTEPLAAVGAALVAAHLFLSFPNGLLGGVRIAVAHRVGAGEERAARALAWQGLWLALALSLAFVPPGVLGAGALLQAFGAEGDVLALGASWTAVRMLGAPFGFLTLAATGFLQGRGDTRGPMVATVLANVLNIALDALLVFGWGPVPALGAVGAAWATSASIAVGAVYLLARLLPAILADRAPPDRALLVEIAAVGAPIGGNHLLNVFGWSVFSSILTHAGPAHLAAHVVGMRIVLIGFLPVHAISEAASVLVGQSLGAGRPERARQAWWAAVRLGVGVMGAAGVAYVVMPGPLVAVFGAEPEVAAVARDLLLVAAAFQLFDAVATVSLGALTGAGDTRFAMLACASAVWIVNLPLAGALALGAGWGAPGAWIGLTAEIVALSAVLAHRVASGRWLGRARIAASPAWAA